MALDLAGDLVRQSAAMIDSAVLDDLVKELERCDIASLRELLASGIDAVFIRPAVSQSKTLPIEDRVRIVWRDEGRTLSRPSAASGSSPVRLRGSRDSTTPILHRLIKTRAA